MNVKTVYPFHNSDSRITILDIPFDAITGKDVLRYVDMFIADQKQHIIVTPNPEMLLISLKDMPLKAMLQQASLSLPDGIGILWASKFLSLPKASFLKTIWQWKKTLWSLLFYPAYCRTILPERITGSDSIKNISFHASEKGYSVFLLGAGEGVAALARKTLEQLYPSINIVGTYAGNPFTEDDHTIVEKINAVQPQILFVAFGSPKQELWIAKNLFRISSVKIAMGIGGSFDFLAGTVKRAPASFRKLGLEWFWRLFQEPRKRLPRIWNAVAVFPVKVLKNKMKMRVSKN